MPRAHVRMRKEGSSSLARRLRCSSDCDVLETLHASSERATGSVAQVPVLGSPDPPTPRHPNLHHHRARNRQLSDVQHPLQLVLIQGFGDLPRESG